MLPKCTEYKWEVQNMSFSSWIVGYVLSIFLLFSFGQKINLNSYRLISQVLSSFQRCFLCLSGIHAQQRSFLSVNGKWVLFATCTYPLYIFDLFPHLRRRYNKRNLDTASEAWIHLFLRKSVIFHIMGPKEQQQQWRLPDGWLTFGLALHELELVLNTWITQLF